ncbi:hypothetical protein C8Q80DRAFT_1347983 [Daedaleopsis nitida]|nr:hypothetical protein C8Q80DRAFT_1347983 [Daedaleopsis nitida]
MSTPPTMPRHLPTFEDIRLGNVPLRRCHHCRYSPGSSNSGSSNSTRQLRRCVGCFKTYYCSTQCQREAWKDYKAECQKIADNSSAPENMRHHEEARSAGFTSAQMFSQALGEFIQAHVFAFQNIAQACVLREGGVVWSQRPQKLLQFYLESSTSLGLHRNPSRTFKLQKQEFVVLDDIFRVYPPAAADWAAMEPERQKVAATFASEDTYAGLLPVRFIVEGVDSSQMHFFAQFLPEAPSNERLMKAALISDIVVFYTGSINTCFPLHHVDGGHPLVSVPGRFTHAQGSWSWKPFFSSWDEYKPDIHKVSMPRSRNCSLGHRRRR